MVKRRKNQSWFMNHWDEIMLIVGYSISIGLLLKANGVF